MESDPELQHLIADLSSKPDREPIASEIAVLQSIYGDNAIRAYHSSSGEDTSDRHVEHSDSSSIIRYEINLNLLSPYEDICIHVLVSLPPSYPASAPPQLQLLSRYIGAFGVDSSLFGSILRTFISVNGVEWSPETVCVFDGLQSVVERCVRWYEERLSAEKAGELVREDLKDHHSEAKPKATSPPPKDQQFEVRGQPAALPAGVDMFLAEPITDRRSVFIGRAFRISDPSQVPLVLSYLMSDRRIARAAHPIINAWRCQIGSVLHQDNDDDDETAAGGRLAHLLQILEVNNVLVVVTRYWGGILLGPDRFKHINQAARNALELGGFLDAPETHKNVGRGKKRS